MPRDIWDDCSAFVTRHLCKIIMVLSAVLLPSVGTGVGWYVSATGELDRLTQQTESRSISTAQALDALTAETRGNNAEIAETLQMIRTDLSVIKYRLDANRMATEAEIAAEIARQ